MPTVLGLMEQEVPEDVYGKDLSQAILEGDEDAVDYVPIWSFYKNSYKGVITKDWTYSITKPEDTSPLHEVLFDRKADPFQLENLSGSEEHQSLRESLWQITGQWMEEVEDEFYTAEDLAVKSKEEWDANRSFLPIDVLKDTRVK
jgi:hypothetical protein